MSIDAQKLAALKAAGQVAAETHAALGALVTPGTNLLEIEKKAKELIEKAGMRPAFLGYKGYPAATCLSVNYEIVHGIPRDYTLQSGDVLAIDLGVENEGWMVDTAVTHAVGQVSPEVENLLKVTKAALTAGMNAARAGNRVGDIGAAVQKVVEGGGLHVIEDLTGHGVGRTLQEPPTIPNHGQPGRGVKLESGMVIAIEPITSTIATEIGILSDGWTIVAERDCLTAHFEHTLVVTDKEPVVLTAIG